MAFAFGISPSSVSGHIVEVTAKKLREFMERDLSGAKECCISLGVGLLVWTTRMHDYKHLHHR
jgi:hypothetical protein